MQEISCLKNFKRNEYSLHWTYIIKWIILCKTFRLRNLRTLTISRLNQPTLSPDNFVEYGVDLEELNINFGNLQTIKSNAFQHVHGLKYLDLSENSIGTIENNAFVDVSIKLNFLQF